MKKLLVYSSFFILHSSFCFAQHSKVNSATMYLTDFIQHGDTTELSLAKGAIDEAALNEKTKDEPKMYLYRGEVYLMLFQLKLAKLAAPPAKPSQAYAQIDTTSISIAASSFIKVLQLAPSPKDDYAEEAKQKQNMPACLAQLQNKSVMEYNTQRYTSALALYEKAMDMDNSMGIKDSSYTEDILGAALAANKAGNKIKALKYYNQLISMKAGGTTPYEGLVNMYLAQKDTANALDYIEKGHAAYPDDIVLINAETNIYLARNNSAKAETNLMLAINKVEQQPEKTRDNKLLARLYSVLGNIYDTKANPKDTKGMDLPKPANYDTLVMKAETNYNKALDLTPSDFDILYNLGALYFNKGVSIAAKANDIPPNEQDKYNKMKADAKAWFLKAQPYFEKAHTIKPTDPGNTDALIKVYGNTGQDDKVKELKAKN